VSGRFKGLNLNTTRKEILDSGYILVRESKWSENYKKDKSGIYFSKLTHGGFDWAVFDTTDPDSLDENEKNDAALAIYGERLNAKIPEVWRRLSIERCGPKPK
jgi:hypothetical protein